MDLATTPLRVASAAKVPAIRHKVRRFAEPLVGAGRARDVELAAAEALANALLHGTGPVTLTASCADRVLRVEVRDQGPGFAVARRVDHGRGLAIVAELADRYGLDRADGFTRQFFEVDL